MADEDRIEEWRPVPGYAGYFVSGCGRVRGRRGRVLAPEATHDGYLRVVLYGASGRCRRMLHRVVADAFLPGDGQQVDHVNGDKRDNRPANLRWVSQSENIRADLSRGVRGAVLPAHREALRREALARLSAGGTKLGVSRALGVSRGWLRKLV